MFLVAPEGWVRGSVTVREAVTVMTPIFCPPSRCRVEGTMVPPTVLAACRAHAHRGRMQWREGGATGFCSDNSLWAEMSHLHRVDSSSVSLPRRSSNCFLCFLKGGTVCHLVLRQEINAVFWWED